MLLIADKARAALTGSVTAAAGQVAAITTGAGALFVGVGGVVATSAHPIRCVLTAVDANGNDTGSYEIVDVTRSSDNLTLVNRGLEGTTAAAWGAGTIIECRPTADLMRTRATAGIVQRSLGTFGGVIVDTAYAGVTMPMKALKVGDTLLVKLWWSHSVGTSQIARYGLAMGGVDVFVPTTTGAAAETLFYSDFIISIQTLTTVQPFGGTWRPNSTFTFNSSAMATATIPDISANDTVIAPRYRIDVAGDTFECVYFGLFLLPAP